MLRPIKRMNHDPGVAIFGGEAMIIYDLRCRGEHTFEGWFKNREIFERQRTEGLIACPVCGDTDPVQVPTPPAIMG